MLDEYRRKLQCMGDEEISLLSCSLMKEDKNMTDCGVCTAGYTVRIPRGGSLCATPLVKG